MKTETCARIDSLRHRSVYKICDIKIFSMHKNILNKKLNYTIINKRDV